jgi:hypothetical protein
MKIMLEHGAQFCSGDTLEKLPTEIENKFLNNIIEFEQQFAAHNTITVFDKIGKPDHFRPVNEISEEDIEQAWKDLLDYMNDHRIDLSACSPKVTAREMYRFATEELFKCETDDINISGMMSCFIYDEFHPDHEYDNARTATDDCLSPIFNKNPFEWMQNFADKICLNDHVSLAKEDFQKLINRFKDAYDAIELSELNTEVSTVKDDCCQVRGKYSACAMFGPETTKWAGSWQVKFEYEDKFGFWLITDVQVENIAF